MTGGALRSRPADPAHLTGNSKMSNQVKIMAILAARAGKAAELRALLDGMIAASRAESGNLRYDLWQDQANPARFVLDELYVDGEAVAAHRATPHFQRYLSLIGDLAERTAVVLDPVAVS
ncbi:putative quinol monooxygenase [Roseomonas populi]|uniref:Antibiotic biosynthesis monooxygenase n=1 Tax=Roseomonas populi TaxID=3121582 RepID=A0ABT1X7X7_9PROT|nr:putative quinol monooxygenase [Roseomonas pecuniae]MCR0983814.1 antibiotic biosynthesis monooxygenase [Roseomonas pecuniae]